MAILIYYKYVELLMSSYKQHKNYTRDLTGPDSSIFFTFSTSSNVLTLEIASLIFRY